ncbi:MAG TPA: hypothetical protein VFV58_31610 [Blastocatellia bacterium]|jgi:hypothetical protein|nr:hypothetical protein [Blastocatellia bacterium]
MPDEPIEVFPGVYTESDGRKVMGLCIVIDNQDGKWEVNKSEHYTTVIKIKDGAKWEAEEYIDPKTHKRKVRIFLEDGKLNSVTLKQFIHPTEEVYTPNGNAANNEMPEVKIFYTTPKDSHTPPIKVEAPHTPSKKLQAT